MRADKFRLLFFGSDGFSIRVLDHLLSKQICRTDVVTRPHTKLDKFSASRQVTRYAWPSGLDHVPENSHNIGLVASFGSLIEAPTVKRFTYGLFNVHPSLLPKYRGSTPIQAAVFDKIEETGCSIMQIPPVAKFDVGDIVLQRRLIINRGEYAIDLRDRLADLGAQMAEEFLLDYETCMKCLKPQDNSVKSLARKLKPEQGHLKFRADTTDLIERKVRAYTGFIDLYINCLGGLRVVLEGMEEAEAVQRYELDCLVRNLTRSQSDMNLGVILQSDCVGHVEAGTMFFHKVRRQLCLKAADNKWLAFKWARPEKKPKMSAVEFFNGYLSKVPQLLRVTDD